MAAVKHGRNDPEVWRSLYLIEFRYELSDLASTKQASGPSLGAGVVLGRAGASGVSTCSCAPSSIRLGGSVAGWLMAAAVLELVSVRGAAPRRQRLGFLALPALGGVGGTGLLLPPVPSFADWPPNRKPGTFNRARGLNSLCHRPNAPHRVAPAQRTGPQGCTRGSGQDQRLRATRAG